ncbi:hypothetical protein TWF718_009771 [Orbilia javanica]|uniref:C2H2-type domain-containing protein n=1 Tax=Orbilia javanica TaxID=47235 RepID=A0AAN8RG13_9PEZI
MPVPAKKCVLVSHTQNAIDAGPQPQRAASSLQAGPASPYPGGFQKPKGPTNPSSLQKIHQSGPFQVHQFRPPIPLSPLTSPSASKMTDIYEVIQTASDQHVRTLLRLLCDSDYNIKSRTAEFHGMIENLQPTGTSLIIESTQSCCSISSDRKRKRDPLEIFYCVNCKECFMDEENDEEACSYHPGEFDPDREDFFADHDEEIHGRLDDEDMFATYPQGYHMSCCGDRGDTVGCYTGQHVGGNRKLKSSGSDDDEADEGDEEADADANGETDRRENGKGAGSEQDSKKDEKQETD